MVQRDSRKMAAVVTIARLEGVVTVQKKSMTTVTIRITTTAAKPVKITMATRAKHPHSGEARILSLMDGDAVTMAGVVKR